ncbi:MAG: DNA cytosine methyltransferase [Chloroflexales bacterium]
MHSYVTATDQFCGAGGSSQGAQAAGVEVRLAMNHWELAIKTHNTNFPNTDHACTDISACDPRRYPSTDILITSPECTNHSVAKGKARTMQAQLELFGSCAAPNASAERSRATMWDVVRFAEHHHYRIIIVENVVEARWWTPFPAWIQAMELLGYTHKAVYLNSMFAHPTPQSRDRMYVIFWKKSLRAPDLSIYPVAHCSRCGQDVQSVQSWKNPAKPYGKYKQQYLYRCPTCADEVTPYYYCAANAIDWSLPAPRIGDRARPLTDKTIKRIEVGLKKFGHQAQLVGNYSPGWTRPVSAPTGTVTAADHHSLLTPPYLVDLRGENAPRAISDVLSTVCASGNHHSLVVPFLSSYYGTDSGSPITAAVPTVPTHDRHSLVVAPFLMSYYTRVSGQQAAVSGLDTAMPTVPGRAVHYLSQPGETPAVEDCGFRMLQPHEIKAAMGFRADYQILGNQRDQVKQCGNAVTPPVMELLIRRCVAVLG